MTNCFTFCVLFSVIGAEPHTSLTTFLSMYDQSKVIMEHDGPVSPPSFSTFRVQSVSLLVLQLPVSERSILPIMLPFLSDFWFFTFSWSTSNS